MDPKKDIQFLTKLNEYRQLIHICRLLYKRRRLFFCDIAVISACMGCFVVAFLHSSRYWLIPASIATLVAGILSAKNNTKVKALDDLMESANNICSIDTLTAMHSVVGKDATIVFDPHPDRTGLNGVESIGVFIALEPWRAKST